MPAITLDIDSLTLGELMEVERQTGEDVQDLLRGKMGRMILAVFVHRWRSSGRAPSWNEIADLRLLDALSSTSDSQPANPSETSRP